MCHFYFNESRCDMTEDSSFNFITVRLVFCNKLGFAIKFSPNAFAIPVENSAFKG